MFSIIYVYPLTHACDLFFQFGWHVLICSERTGDVEKKTEVKKTEDKKTEDKKTK